MARSQPSFLHSLWWQRIIALLTLINLGLVLFNYSYLALRDFYVRVLPGITQLYDPVKGVQPHWETQNYLTQVDTLVQQLEQQGQPTAIVEPQLEELRRLSRQMVTANPFEGAGRESALAKLEFEITNRTGANSSLDGFDRFWSADHLTANNWQTELAFFNTELRPFLAANYYRDVNRFGGYVDYFWLIDLPFILLFGIDLLARTFSVSQRRPDLTWPEALLRNWFDLPLLLPFWRWLRIIPVVLRLSQVRWLNLDPVRVQLNHDFAIGFAQEITEMVGVQVIDQMQDFVEEGELARWLFDPAARRAYVQINNTNEVEAIVNRLMKISVYNVLPQVQPEMEAFIYHSLASTLEQSSLYRQIQSLPGLSQLPTQMTEKLSGNLSHAVYDNLIKAIEDDKGSELAARLRDSFQSSLEAELQKSHNLKQLETWIVDLLEEIKINYVKSIAEGDIAKAVEETEQLQRKAVQPHPKATPLEVTHR